MDELLYQEIERLCRLTRERGLKELAITQAEFSLSLTAMPATASTVPTIPAGVAFSPLATVEEPCGQVIPSPLIGIFYRTPSPDSPPFVEIGELVEVGQTIGVVEAMKVFNEITSDVAGRVIAIPAEHGMLVQVGQPLVVLDFASE